MSKFNIREYQPNDYAEVCRIHDVSRKEELTIGGAEKYFIPLETAPYKDDFFSCKIYVAYDADSILGFVAVHPQELDYIYVDPIHQNKGIGYALATTALRYMSRSVSLDVFAENTKAKKLYKKLGFKCQEVRYQQWDLNDPKKYSGEKMILN